MITVRSSEGISGLLLKCDPRRIISLSFPRKHGPFGKGVGTHASTPPLINPRGSCSSPLTIPAIFAVPVAEVVADSPKSPGSPPPVVPSPVSSQCSYSFESGEVS